MSSSADVAVSLDRVWKRYVLGQGAGARGALLSLVGRGPSAARAWALRDLSLEIRAGESIGLIGHNGAGKSTALKLLAGISRPTRGSVRVRGRVAALINVGAGFHRELSGRENVALNGVILGLTRRETEQRYEAIVDFAGLQGFMDTPVKRYSAGMYARLAFSVAAHADPDVLLVDEVLSVGDAEFQERSLRRMLRFRDSGVAVVFVSHNLGAVETMCQRVAWLERGAVRALGPASEVIRGYLDAVDEDAGEGTSAGRAAMSIQRATVVDGDGRALDVFLSGEAPLTVRVEGTAHVQLLEPAFIVTIRGDEGPLFAANMLVDGRWPAEIPVGPFVVEARFEPPRLAPGTYRVEVKVKQNVRTNYYEPRVVARFRVAGADAGRSGAAIPCQWTRVP